jgi:hypothetical protein
MECWSNGVIRMPGVHFQYSITPLTDRFSSHSKQLTSIRKMERNYPSTGVHRSNARTRTLARVTQIDSENWSHGLWLALIIFVTIWLASTGLARDLREKWVATWAASMQGTLGVGPAAPYGDRQ